MVIKTVDETHDNLTTLIVNGGQVIIRRVLPEALKEVTVFVIGGGDGIGGRIGDELCLEYVHISPLLDKPKMTREQKQDRHIQIKQFEQQEKKNHLSKSRSIRNPRYEL